jgi:uncharacterized membrane protein
MRVSHLVLAGTLCAAALPAVGQLTIIEPANGYLYSDTQGLSSDGRTAVGNSWFYNVPSGTTMQPFVWSRETGRTGTTVGNAVGNAISGVGNTAYARAMDFSRIFRWSNGTGQDLGSMPGHQRVDVTSTSGDGSVFVGAGANGTGSNVTQTPYRWTQASGYTPIPFQNPFWTWGEAAGVSRDGSVVVGTNAPSFFGSFRAYRWTPDGGTVPLATGSGFDETWAHGVSGDGRLIIGHGNHTGSHQAAPWIWTASAGMMDLPTPDVFRDGAADVTNNDGSIISGWFTFEGSTIHVPYLWTASGGLVRFSDFLTGYGLTLPSGYAEAFITGISDDGLTYSGTLRNPSQGDIPGRGFIVTVPTPSCGVFLGSGMLLCSRRRRP